MRALTRLAFTAMTAVVAYMAAIVCYAAVTQLAKLPDSIFWDDSLRYTIRLILLVILMIGWLVPAMRYGATSKTKTQSALFALALAAYTTLKLSGLADPDIPQGYVKQWVAPLQERIRAM